MAQWAEAMTESEEAVLGGGHIDLGYRSPGDYLHAEFDGVLSGLDVGERRVAVRTMTAWGLSTRAIAKPLGVGQSTVRDDTQVSGTHSPVDPPKSPEAEVSPPPEVVATDDSDVESSQAEVSEPPPAPRSPVVGIDGKTYTRPAAPSRPTPKPVLSGSDAEYANAEQANKSLSRAIAKLLEFEHPNMRAGMRRYWSMASVEVPPAQRADVTPEQMRVAAHGLLTLADEWNR